MMHAKKNVGSTGVPICKNGIFIFVNDKQKKNFDLQKYNALVMYKLRDYIDVRWRKLQIKDIYSKLLFLIYL